MVNISDNRFATLRSGSPLGRMLTDINCPHSSLRFLILDCPTESTLDFYIEEFKRFRVSHVVRCCQPTYNAQRLASCNIVVKDLPFKDGGVPPQQVLEEWLALLEAQIKKNDDSMIAVHCVAGLGRAPVLVAIALIEMGMEPLQSIEYIRSKRRGAFNKPQIAYLDTYKRQLKSASSSSAPSLLVRMFRIGKTSSGSGSGNQAAAGNSASTQQT